MVSIGSVRAGALMVLLAALTAFGCTSRRSEPPDDGGAADAGGRGGGSDAGGRDGSSAGTDGGMAGVGGTIGTGGNVAGGSGTIGTGGNVAGAGGYAGGAAGTSGTGGNAGGGSGGRGGGAAGTVGAAGTGGAGAGGRGGSTAGTGGAGGPACGAGMHSCPGTGCVSNNSPSTCGSLCSACTAPSGGTPTCDGTTCGFDCGALKKCTAAMICIPTTGCCTNTDCPTMSGGQVGTCDSGTHTCNYSCPSGMQSCTSGGTTICIAASGCCQNSDCAGMCRSCAANHTCVAATNQDDPNGRCAGTCDATGACKSKRGQVCNATAGGCLANNPCSPDGYCCDQACNGSCMACDIVGYQGTCTPVASGPPHSNHTACAGGTSSCAGSCQGRTDGACVYPTINCGAGPSCTGSSSTAQSTCSAGSCVTPAPVACSGNFVCGTTTCRTSCTADADCVSGYYCSGGTCHMKAVKVAHGGDHGCAVLTDGSVRCWGNNTHGQLGIGSLTTTAPYGSYVPVPVIGLSRPVTAISAGYEHTCVIVNDGGVWCWGGNTSGGVGNGMFNNGTGVPTPSRVTLAATATQISVGDGFACAALTGGGVWCWGANGNGQLGSGTFSTVDPYGIANPVQATSGNNPSGMSLGSAHGCLYYTLADMYCWGSDYFNQLGNDALVTRSSPFGIATPQTVANRNGNPVAIAAGNNHSCMIYSSGRVDCWGANASGQVGNGTFSAVDPNAILTPTQVMGITGSPSAIEGGSHTCVMTTDGKIWCWGYNVYGNLGRGTTTPNAPYGIASAAAVTGLSATNLPTALTVGSDDTCVLLANGSIACWGYNATGELGNGTAVDSAVPVPVTGW